MAIVAVIFLAGGWLAVRTFGTNGDEAIARMSGDERAFLVKLQSLRRGMTYAEAVAVLGEPDEAGPLMMRPKWQVGGNPLDAAVVYILPDGAHRFTWISIGRFTYSQELRRRTPASPGGGV